MKNFLYETINFGRKHINWYFIVGGIASILLLLFNILVMINGKSFDFGTLISPIVYIAVFVFITLAFFNQDTENLKILLLIYYCYYFISSLFCLGTTLDFANGFSYSVSTIFNFIALLGIVLVGIFVIIQKIKNARQYGLIINWTLMIVVGAFTVSILFSLISGIAGKINFWYALSTICYTIIDGIFALIFLVKYNEKSN